MTLEIQMIAEALTFGSSSTMFSKLRPWSPLPDSLNSSTISQTVDSANGRGSLSSSAKSIFSRCFIVSIGLISAAEAAENPKIIN